MSEVGSGRRGALAVAGHVAELRRMGSRNSRLVAPT
jgi:hypothetical protein